MPSAKITSKGQITIPIEVRKKLGLKAGDQIEFYSLEDGKYAFRPKTGSIMEMEGILKRLGLVQEGHIVSVEEMNQAVLDAVSKDYMRLAADSTDEGECAKAS
jgi:AbrB family looped-hinge helix DNA binding protein